MVAMLNHMSEWTIAQEEPEHFERYGAQGCSGSKMMYYLVETRGDNGCLPLIPCSHLKRHPLHNLGREVFENDGVQRAIDMNHPALAGN